MSKHQQIPKGYTLTLHGRALAFAAGLHCLVLLYQAWGSVLGAPKARSKRVSLVDLLMLFGAPMFSTFECSLIIFTVPGTAESQFP
jgi:hypothetical protein